MVSEKDHFPIKRESENDDITQGPSKMFKPDPKTNARINSTEKEISSVENQDMLEHTINTEFSQVRRLITSFSFSAKLMSKGPIQKQYYARGNMFEFEMRDHSGKMKGRVFNQDCEVLYPLLKVDSVYRFHNAVLSASSPNTMVKGFELIFSSDTFITEINDVELEKLQDNYKITTYAKILTLPAGELIDYIGRIVSIGEIETVQKKDGMNLLLRNVEIVDKNDNKITVVFWNKIATDGIASLGIGKTVLFKQLKINEYKGEKKLFYNVNSKMLTELSTTEIERYTTESENEIQIEES